MGDVGSYSGISGDRTGAELVTGSEEQHHRDPEQHAASLAHAAIAEGNATGWFEQVYADAAAGKTSVPWDRGQANQLLVQ